MKVLFFFLLPFSLLSQTKVNVQILQTQHYCGGIKPPKEILDQYAIPKPYANKKFVLVSANGKTCKVKTDANGYLKVKLKAGSYKGYEEWRYTKSVPEGNDLTKYDPQCLQENWKKVDLTIEAQKKTQNVVVTIDEAYCPHTIPCLLNPTFPE